MRGIESCVMKLDITREPDGNHFDGMNDGLGLHDMPSIERSAEALCKKNLLYHLAVLIN